MKNSPRLNLLLLVMVTFWSGNYIVGKLALREFPPLLLSGIRLTMAAAMMLPFYGWQRLRTQVRWTRADVPLLICLGLLGMALNQVLFVLGLSRTSVAHAAILVGLTPVVVLVIAAMMRLERLTPRKATGVLVALAGVAVLKALDHGGNGPRSTLLGDALILLSGLAFALFATFGKRTTGRHTSITVNTFAYVSGAVALAPITIWQGWNFPFSHVSLAAWLSVTYMALFPSAICYLIFYYALGHITASRVSAYSYLQPVMATLMGVMVLNEHVTTSLVVGGAVILLGVSLTERG